MVTVSWSRLQVQTNERNLLRLVIVLRVGRVAEALRLIVLTVLGTCETFLPIVLFERRIALRVDPVVLDEKSVIWRNFRLDVLPASTLPPTWN
jgi:hypothetical protein